VRAIVVFAGIGVLACSSEQTATTSEYLLQDVTPSAKSESWRIDTSRASITVEERIVDPSFGRIGPVGADAEGRLVIYDPTECKFILFSADRASRKTFGRCGEGPGEFGSVVSVSFSKNHLFVVNSEPAFVAWVAEDGTEVRRMSLKDVSAIINDVEQIDDTTLAVPRVKLASSKESLIALVDIRTGRTRVQALKLPGIVTSNPSARLEYLNICQRPTPDHQTIIAMQQWLMQSVELTADSLKGVSNYHTRTKYDGGVAPTFPGRSVGRLRPNFRETDVVCNDIGVISWARTVNWDELPPRNLNSLLEVRGYDGRRVYLGNNPPGIPPLARIVAGWRDHLIFVSNDDVPALFITRINVH